MSEIKVFGRPGGGTRQLSLPGVSMKKLVYTNLNWYAYSIRGKCDQNMFRL